MPASDRGERLRGDRGQVAGIEVLPFGFLVLVVGSLLLFNAWAAIDAKLAVVAASREGARAAAETVSGADDAARAGAAEAQAAMVAQGRGEPDRLKTSVDVSDYRRCGRISVTVEYSTPAIALPLIGSGGSGLTMRSTHSELVDGFRGGLDVETSRC